MFTGLIQRKGRLRWLEASAEAGRMVIETGTWTPGLSLGESVAVSGACLTVVERNDKDVTFDVLQETIQRTSFKEKKPGDSVNLERALRMGEPLGGHVVQGHVDGVGRVKSCRRTGGDRVVEIICERALLSEMVVKGSIACDGISLTLVDVGAGSFVVHIIPHTWERTALSDLKVGDAVNLETDIIGKYVKKFLGGGSISKPITMDSLRDAGFC